MFNSYKNPFIAYNTNGMASEQISELFTDPYVVLNKTRQDIISDKSSMIFVGSRGTGKTMILKQFSYNVQRVALNEHISFLEKVRAENFIGVYFRVDNALIKSLDSVSDYVKNLPAFSENLFTHYFELTVFKDLLEIIKIFLKDSKVEVESENYKTIIKKLSSLLSSNEGIIFSDIEQIINYVISQINYIWSYQSKKAIDITGSVNFDPDCGLILQGRLTNELLGTSVFELFGISDINILLLIDEFESFSEKQQRVLNTAMRFSKEQGVCYRIGMRPYGFKTHGTLDNEDFIKEGRDYQEIGLDFYYVGKGQAAYVEFVREIANKRLSHVAQFVGKDIESFLGKAENLEQEAKEIVKKRDNHISAYLSLINKERKKQKKSEITKDEFKPLRDDNPLYEMENLLLLLRGNELEYVIRAFSDYKAGKSSEPRDKYANDYDRKYKLCFVFILCTIYRSERKGYYGFKDYCQMSSGIIAHFIELCRRAFEIAYFKDQDALLVDGHISPAIQTEAAYDTSQTEREMIEHINDYGKELDIFIRNLGNAFGHIHKDKYIRYPETNLFPVSDSISDENIKLIKIACMWSLVIKKPIMQDSSASGEKRDVYFINRMFAPSFKISYRTRGGLNPVIVGDEYFSANFDPQSVLVSKKRGKHLPKEDVIESTQISLFSSFEQDPRKPQSNSGFLEGNAMFINIDTQEGD